MATSLSTLKARIASELHRSNLTSEIALAISSAIRFYRSKRFEFNEKQASFNTVASQEAYTTATIPSDIGAIDSLRATVNGRVCVLEPITLHELQERNSTATLTGAPSAFAFYAQSIFLAPVPDAAYQVSASYQQRKAEPANDADDTTVWTNEAEPLIRARAKMLIYRDVTRDTAGMQLAQMAEAEALAMLEKESLQLQDDGPLGGSWI